VPQTWRTNAGPTQAQRSVFNDATIASEKRECPSCGGGKPPVRKSRYFLSMLSEPQMETVIIPLTPCRRRSVACSSNAWRFGCSSTGPHG